MTLIAAISLTLAGVILSYVEAEELITFRLPLALICLGLVWFGWWSRSAGRRMTDN